MSHMRPHSFASPTRTARTARNKNEHETNLFPSYWGSDKSDYLPQTFDIRIYIYMCIYPIVLIYCLLLEPKHTLAYVCFIASLHAPTHEKPQHMFQTNVPQNEKLNFDRASICACLVLCETMAREGDTSHHLQGNIASKHSGLL